MSELINVVNKAYEATKSILREPEMCSVATGGVTILYGPPIFRPDLFLISFQGGGAAPLIYETWPERLLYLEDEFKSGHGFKFGKNLCRYAKDAGLDQILAMSTMAIPVVFCGEKVGNAGKWMARSGPRAHWRDFSVSWVERIIDAARPKAIIVFGDKTSKTLGLSGEWSNCEYNHGQGFMTQGLTEYRNIPTVYCGHLSQGFVGAEVVRSFDSARKIICKLSE